ncbi:MAG: two-component system LytT family sensor kinase [Patiriisocius sp.]|jgi:hypothetical protein
MKISNSVLFWVLQVIGWGIPTVLNNAAKVVSGNLESRYYGLAELLLVFISGITITTLLRFYLKRTISFDAFRRQDIIHIVGGFIVAATLFALSFLLTIPIYNYFHGKPLEMETVIIVANILNAFGFIFLWLLCYIPIKIARHSRKNRVERLELQTSLKEAQLNTLKGQINPHFMFNSLNNIRGLMLEDVEKSREMITRLSDMLRYSLTKNDVDTIPLKNELEMVDNYIALSKIQLEDRLSFSSEISEILYTTEIPPMLIQMLVENAVKHGISNEKDGGHVALNISEKNKNLFIEITNTGSLIQAKGSTKIGLKNIAERLALLYGDTARFELSEKDHLVTALIQIPM